MSIELSPHLSPHLVPLSLCVHFACALVLVHDVSEGNTLIYKTCHAMANLRKKSRNLQIKLREKMALGICDSCFARNLRF